MKQVEKIEQGLHDFLLRDVIFIIKDGKKPIKRGKLILFKFKEFHFVFTLKNDKGENRIYEVPYPYSWNKKDRSMEFSYNIDDFTLINSNLYYRIKVLDTSNSNKLYNNSLVLSAL